MDDSDRPHYLVRDLDDLDDLGDEFGEMRTYAEPDAQREPREGDDGRLVTSDCSGVYLNPDPAAAAPETWPQTRAGRRTGAPRPQQIEHRPLPARARARIRCIVVEFLDGRRMVLK